MAYNRPYIEHNVNPMFQHRGNQPVPPNMMPGNFFGQPRQISNNQPDLPIRQNFFSGQNPYPIVRQTMPPHQMHGPANSMVNRMPFMAEEPIMGQNMQCFGGPMQNQQTPSHFRMRGMHTNRNRFMNRPQPPPNQNHDMNVFNNVRMTHQMMGDKFPVQSFTHQSWNCPMNTQTFQSGVKRPEVASQTGRFCKNFQNSSTQSSDALVVEGFLKKIEKHTNNLSKVSAKEDITSKPQDIKICEAQRLRRKADELLEKLESINESGKLFNAESAAIYKELDTILTTLSNEAVIKGLKKKIEQRRKRRLRIKKKKHSVYLVEKERRERIEEKHSQIEDWLKSEKVKHETQLRDNEMQRQLDEALTEVRKEESTLNKSVDLINALDKLRKARLQTLKSSGREVPSDVMTNNFHDLVEITKKKLQSQILNVEKKSNALKMFVETEQKEVRSLLMKQKKIKEEKRRKNWEDERKQNLFGKFELELDAFDPMWPVHQLHQQSQVDVNTLVEYRRQWDQFINNEGSEIPINWVEPVQSPSEQWKKYSVECNSVDQKLPQ
uniref:programmed cell death protein 7-like isoform X2 n=1 Tax=Ciona intestinalis TaxID=7719 RepID=UPI000EF4B6B8|nr:programmed cell death protein 7-like isoform X2 [Ciona intestinalis]|eukprot:XP_026695444.1 programmed cell death protein 7-like isoform X2 [Ciona intestinalis]